jgi:hypothetical protein
MIRQFFTHYKRWLSVAGLVAMLAFSSAPIASAQIGKDAICKGVGFASQGSSSDCTNTSNGGTGTVEDTIHSVVNILSFVVGVISVIMVVIGGLRYALSGGDPGNVEAAKNTILYAVVGLVIVIFAQIIVNFVVFKVTAPNK